MISNGKTLIAGLLLLAAAADVRAATAVLDLSPEAGVVDLGRADLAFNFHDGQPGVDGKPFGIGAYGPHGFLDAPGKPAVFSQKDWNYTADCGGKYAVTVRWTRGYGAAEGNRVYADVTIANHTEEPILGFTLDLLRLRFPTPVVANDGNSNLRAYNTGGPGIFFANYAGVKPGALACDLEDTDATHALLMKLERGNAQDTEGTLVVMNHHDYEDGGSPYPYWPVPAGGTVHFRVGLRFLEPLPDPAAACGDLFAAFARRYPVTPGLRAWTDRRPIAQVFFEANDTNGGRNPRKWFDASLHLDVTTAAGVKLFQKMVFDRAHSTLERMKKMNAQGVITWDIEGAQFPAATYMGDPSKLSPDDLSQSVAPEMAAIADRYFKIYRDAGFRVGVTLRPQKVVLLRDAKGRLINGWETDDQWDWKSDPPADLQAFWQQQLEEKIRYARKRWGATLFYVDSNGDPGSPVSFLVFRNLSVEFPDILLIPEQSTMGYYCGTAPYRQLNMLAPNKIVSPLVRETWPGAGCFGVINPTIESMEHCWPQLVQEIREGDILFFRGWYECAELPAIRKAYAEAGKKL
ncbi:MAG TPA: hypothetical protein VHY22_11035 [Chthoniobacteraceae bacterium]|jgi:hypothetical protein|nr:hypothetical protein [Chthoniobacteraceae bacterium]